MTVLTWRPDDPLATRWLLSWLDAKNVSHAEGPIISDILWGGVPMLLLPCAGLPDIVIRPGGTFRLEYVRRNPVQPVNGCRVCGRLERDHPNLWTFQYGYHHWIAPDDTTRKIRLRLQRQLRKLSEQYAASR